MYSDHTPDNEKKRGDKLFAVVWSVDATGSHRVWAKNADHAKELSQDLFFATSENTEIGDGQEIVDIVELVKGEDY